MANSDHLVRWLLRGALLIALLLSGCGFHLRGTSDVPEGVSPVYIEGGGVLVKILRERLLSSDQELATSSAGAKSVIRILGESVSNRVLSVNKGGKVIAYERHYQARFSATSRTGKAEIPPQSINLVRNFINPDTEVLGKALEADLITADMREDAARQILLRVSAQWR